MTDRAGDRYDVIGRSYADARRQDPRVAAQLHAALREGSVVNIGAGSGNYEPTDRLVVAAEPSAEMIRQRKGRPAPVVRAAAEALPFADGAFDNAMALMTVHHWSDPVAGLTEMRRVARRQVVFFYERELTHRFWALEYFPAALSLPFELDPPGEAFFREHLNVIDVRPVLVPKDCTDGFGAAFWARPGAYADPAVQAGMSFLAMLPVADREAGAARLVADLASGEWDRRYGHLRDQDVFDGGYRVATAE